MNIILIIILLVIILILIWALLGGKSDIINGEDEGGRDENKTFRRRAADKQIEKEFPESAKERETESADRSMENDHHGENQGV